MINMQCKHGPAVNLVLTIGRQEGVCAVQARAGKLGIELPDTFIAANGRFYDAVLAEDGDRNRG